MKEKKKFTVSYQPQCLNDLDLPANVVKMQPKANDFQMRLHNILAQVKHQLNRPYPDYPDDSKD